MIRFSNEIEVFDSKSFNSNSVKKNQLYLFSLDDLSLSNIYDLIRVEVKDGSIIPHSYNISHEFIDFFTTLCDRLQKIDIVQQDLTNNSFEGSFQNFISAATPSTAISQFEKTYLGSKK